ncbi:MAG: hypothetical protein JSS51_12630 [Planctomycetes bacterium]|nr:hypothetical protein [Planctomycetota bacterium]
MFRWAYRAPNLCQLRGTDHFACCGNTAHGLISRGRLDVHKTLCAGLAVGHFDAIDLN